MDCTYQVYKCQFNNCSHPFVKWNLKIGKKVEGWKDKWSGSENKEIVSKETESGIINKGSERKSRGLWVKCFTRGKENNRHLAYCGLGGKKSIFLEHNLAESLKF